LRQGYLLGVSSARDEGTHPIPGRPAFDILTDGMDLPGYLKA
jgi:hypothetical protein